MLNSNGTHALPNYALRRYHDRLSHVSEFRPHLAMKTIISTIRKPLRPLLFTLSTLLLAGSASAEWIVLGRTENFRIFLEQKQILRNGDLAQIWQLMDFTVAQWADPQTVVWSIRTLAEYDCKEPRFRTLVSEAYSEQMSLGKLIAREQPAEPQWERIEAGGPPDKIRQVACGGKEK